MAVRKKTKLIDAIAKFGLEFSPIQAIADYIKTNKAPTKIKLALAQFLMYARSETEYRWYQTGKAMITAEFKQDILFVGYEWISFKLPGGSYTPDFLYILKDGSHVFVEVKASQHQAGYRDARAKLRACASLNPWYTFMEARLDKTGWIFEKIEPDTTMIATIIGYDNVEN